MADTDKAYLGVKPCGCGVFVMVVGCDTQAEKRELAEQLRRGLEIEVTTVAEARSRFTLGCPHGGGRVGRDEARQHADRLVSEARA